MSSGGRAMSPAPAQYLLAHERQRTIEGAWEPPVAPVPVVEVVRGELADTRTGELFSGGGPVQAELPYVPKSVRACQDRAWHVQFWPRNEPTKRQRAHFRCDTWRCNRCRRQVAARDFARINAALAPLPVEELLYVVATLDQRADAARGMTKRTAYGETLVRRVQSFVQWIRRNHDAGARYVLTVEQHRSGWPHVNIILHAPELARALALEEREDGYAPRWLSDAAVSCGLGRQLWAQTPKGSRETLAGYIVKLAHQETLATAGEVAKLTQLPVTAPPRTRRLRSSKGFLPKRTKREGFTGMLHRKALEAGLALDTFLDTFAPLPHAPEPQGGPEGGAAPAQPPPVASGGGGEATEEQPAALVSIRLSHSPSPTSWTPKVLPGGHVEPPNGPDGPTERPRWSGDGPDPQHEVPCPAPRRTSHASQAVHHRH